MKSNRAIAVLILSILILGTIIIMRINSQIRADRNVEADRPVVVSVACVGYGRVTNKIDVTGAVEGINEGEIVSETSGKVVEILADVDSYLPKGGPIAQVESELQEISLEQARAQTAAAQANCDKANLDLKRIESLYAQNAVSESQKENTELAAKAAVAQLRSAQAAEKLAQKRFDDTMLRTPVAGRLAQKFITVGKMVTPGMKVATVVDDSRLKLDVGVPEEDVSSVRRGDSVQIRSDAAPGLVFHGIVKSVALKADAMTRTFQVEIEFPNDGPRSMKSGMFARAAITASVIDSALVVPAGAVIESEGSTYSVFVVKGSQAATRRITIGTRTDSLVTVTGGLAEGDTVVAFGPQNLKSGMRVTYRTPD